MDKIAVWAQKLSLKEILSIAIIIRVVAIVFSKGYAFMDDHFEVIEVANALNNGEKTWADGEVYLFSLIYIYVHAFVFQFSEWVGYANPEVKMLFTRVLHAFISLFTVYFGYRIAEKISNKNTANYVGLALALFWVFPFMSVRNLREFICIPFLMAAFYFLIINEQKKILGLILAGCLFGAAFIFRVQAAFFPLGVGLLLLYKWQWKKLLILTLSTLLFILSTQGVFEYYYWGDCLASIKAYIIYNFTMGDSGAYPIGPWYMFINTVLGLTLPVFSIYICIGYVKAHKIAPEIFWGSLAFFIFHSYFPNKQERFILPFLPFFLILGIIGIYELRQKSSSIFLHGRIFNVSLWIFLILNTIALILLSITYSKKSRVEAMLYFYDKPNEKNIVVAYKDAGPSAPVFYCGKNATVATINMQSPNFGITANADYIVITKENDKESVLKKLEENNLQLVFEKSFNPSIVDHIAFLLNPKHNVNETWYVYRVSKI